MIEISDFKSSTGVMLRFFLYTCLTHLFHFRFIINMFSFDCFKNMRFTFTFHYRLNMQLVVVVFTCFILALLHMFYMPLPCGLLLFKLVEYHRRTLVCSLLRIPRILPGYLLEHWLDVRDKLLGEFSDCLLELGTRICLKRLIISSDIQRRNKRTDFTNR